MSQHDVSPQNSPRRIDLDIVLIGGGIAGLWLANRLKTAGFSVALFEHNALGSDQTIASQGMIHGGMKYTLSGALTSASETIADMPEHWRACLCGEGDVDLRNTRILSDHFFLWSGDSIAAKLTSFFASKATRGRVDSVPDHKRPPLLRHADFNGSLYKLTDIVLDVHSLVTNLARNIEGQAFLLDWSQARLIKSDDDTVALTLGASEQLAITLHAQRFIFCAGKGNADLLATLGVASPAMQVRPLQQVMVKHQHPYVFYGHCLGTDTTPRLTISTHRLSEHERVWYLGGSLAEKGASMDADQLIDQARQELAELIPWVNLTEADWATLPVTRAEPLQPHFVRPDNAFVTQAAGCANVLVAWPTKLTLAPNLANQTLGLLADAQVQPGDARTGQQALHQLQQGLAAPEIAPTPWELAFPPEISAEERLELKFAAEQKAADDQGRR